MPIADFVHLKVRSAYSLTEGANKIEAIVSLAKANQMPAVGVTDRNNLFGALEFAQYAAKGGIQPITGCELGIRREEGTGNAPPGKIVPADWLTLLVQNETGYRNLMAANAFKAKRKVWITANNKAEGSAPLSLVKLAEEIANNLQS